MPMTSTVRRELRVAILMGRVQLRESLAALLTTVPHVAHIDRFATLASGMDAMMDAPPDTIVVDYTLIADRPDALRAIKAEWPRTRCLVLTDRAQQSPDAAASGADCVLLKGVDGTTLIDAISGHKLSE